MNYITCNYCGHSFDIDNNNEYERDGKLFFCCPGHYNLYLKEMEDKKQEPPHPDAVMLNGKFANLGFATKFDFDVDIENCRIAIGTIKNIEKHLSGDVIGEVRWSKEYKKPPVKSDVVVSRVEIGPLNPGIQKDFETAILHAEDRSLKIAYPYFVVTEMMANGQYADCDYCYFIKPNNDPSMLRLYTPEIVDYRPSFLKLPHEINKLVESASFTISGQGSDDFSKIKKALDGLEEKSKELRLKDIRVKLDFSNVTGIKSVSGFASNALSNYTVLEEIKLPDGVTKINAKCFDGCRLLKKVTIPNTVEVIETGAFYKCKSLEEIEIPNGVKEITCDMFFGCESLRKVTIPDTVESIGDRAFYQCKSLKEIEIPNGIKEIACDAFFDCESLRKITIPSTIETIKDNAFHNCKLLEEIEISDGIKEIGTGSFVGCESLKHIRIPKSVQLIGGGAFCGCSPSAIECLSSSYTVMDNFFVKIYKSRGIKYIDIVSALYDNSEMTIPNEITSAHKNAFLGCNFLDSLTVPAIFDVSKIDLKKDVTIFRLPKTQKQINKENFNHHMSKINSFFSVIGRILGWLWFSLLALLTLIQFLTGTRISAFTFAVAALISFPKIFSDSKVRWKSLRIFISVILFFVAMDL